jgi:hypothetical protein
MDIVIVWLILTLYVVFGIVFFVQANKYMTINNLFSEWRTSSILRKIYLSILFMVRFVFWFPIFIGFMCYRKRIKQIYKENNG